MSDLPKPLTEDQIQEIVSSAVKDARSYVKDEFYALRIRADRYYNGEVDLESVEGLSTSVFRLTEMILDALVVNVQRVFSSSDKVVIFTPNNQDEIRSAEEATKYIHDRFDQLGGQNLLDDCIIEAGLHALSVVKVTWDTEIERTVHHYQNLNEMELQLLVSDPDITVLEHEQVTVTLGPEVVESQSQALPVNAELGVGMMTASSEEDGPVGLESVGPEGIAVPVSDSGIIAVGESVRHNLTISRQKSSGKLNLEAIPINDFFVDRGAKDIRKFYIIGNSSRVRAHELVAQGFDPKVIYNLTVKQRSDTDVQYNNQFGFQEEEEEGGKSEIDSSMKMINLTEAYMRMDVEGTGEPFLYKFILAEADTKVLHYEAVSEPPYAVFELIPSPHRFFGKCLIEALFDDQDLLTGLLRELFNGIAFANRPRMGIVDGMVNPTDVVNHEIGGIVRMKQQGMASPLTMPFDPTPTLDAIRYIHKLVEDRIGVNTSGTGLNPNALQDVREKVMDQALEGGAGRLEKMAKNIAKTGAYQLFRLMYNLIIENEQEELQLSDLDHSFNTIDPRSWRSDINININVGLGKGTKTRQADNLQQVMQLQNDVRNISNGEGVRLEQIYNTAADLLATYGIFNPKRYFTQISVDQEQAMRQQQAEQIAASDQGGGDGKAYLYGEEIKAKSSAELAVLKAQLEKQKVLIQDDRERDKMEADFIIKMLELGIKNGIPIDQDMILDYMQRPRSFPEYEYPGAVQ